MDRTSPITEVTSTQISYEEFLAWTEEDVHAEWVNGEVRIMSPVSSRHQDVADFLTSVLRIFVENRHAGVIRSAPIQMKLENSGREPDILFLASEHLDRLKKTYLEGPADLVIEIISPESAGRDRGDKFYEYEAEGVPEYWLINPLHERVEFYQLDESHYHLAFSGAEGVYQSSMLPDFWLHIEWLWQEPLPPVLDVLRELGVI